ncbi:hypothetical protein [Streptomyces sp. KR80]|uniref:hypothetical protein n=1 Tax=Streptomyces sp. KR80 TaxID=3457426 RepID=UPI003FD0C294
MGEALVRGGAVSRRIALGAAAVVAFGMVGLAGAGAARAAEAARCPGWKVKTLTFASGYVRIYKSNNFVCAVTVAKNPGPKRKMSVSVQARGGHPYTDSGWYTRHAGPVRVSAGGRCVLVRGSIGSHRVSSGWILC